MLPICYQSVGIWRGQDAGADSAPRLRAPVRRRWPRVSAAEASPARHQTDIAGVLPIVNAVRARPDLLQAALGATATDRRALETARGRGGAAGAGRRDR